MEHVESHGLGGIFSTNPSLSEGMRVDQVFSVVLSGVTQGMLRSRVRENLGRRASWKGRTFTSRMKSIQGSGRLANLLLAKLTRLATHFGDTFKMIANTILPDAEKEYRFEQ